MISVRSTISRSITVKSRIKETAFKKLSLKILEHGEYKTRNILFKVMISTETDLTHLTSFKKWNLKVIYASGLAPNLKCCQETVRLATKIQFLLCGKLLYPFHAVKFQTQL